ncbi:hypothetical protein MASR1M45_02890 [Candidatus Kapaibacterium sp.]
MKNYQIVNREINFSNLEEYQYEAQSGLSKQLASELMNNCLDLMLQYKKQSNDIDEIKELIIMENIKTFNSINNWNESFIIKDAVEVFKFLITEKEKHIIVMHLENISLARIRAAMLECAMNDYSRLFTIENQINCLKRSHVEKYYNEVISLIDIFESSSEVTLRIDQVDILYYEILPQELDFSKKLKEIIDQFN